MIFLPLKYFFLDFGLEVLGEGEVKGKWVHQVIGLNNVKAAVVMLGTPGGQAHIELVKFYTPSDEKGIQQSFANTLGIRHIAFAVEDIEAIVAKLKKKGTEIFSEVQHYAARSTFREPLQVQSQLTACHGRCLLSVLG